MKRKEVIYGAPYGWPTDHEYISRWNALDMRTAMYRTHLKYPVSRDALRYLADLLGLNIDRHLDRPLHPRPPGGWPEEGKALDG